MTVQITNNCAWTKARTRTFAAVLAVLLLAAIGAIRPPIAFADVSSSGECASAEAPVGTQTIRVGFPRQEGLSETAEDGTCSGYTYEYLEQIAQYTGWNYEFVTVEGTIDEQLSKLLEMLEAGDIDILGAMNYSDALAETYDYATKPYGYAHTALFAADENKAITDTNIYRLEHVCVARSGQSPKHTAELETFCEMNDIDLEIVQCDSIDEQIALVLEGAADLALGVDVSPLEGLHVVSTFTPKPFYFAATKGKRVIVSQLNEAITSIDNAEPQLQNDLYKKYFGSDAELYGISPEMYVYIGQSRVVRIGYTAGEPPIQDADDETGALQGATAGALSHIAEYTGLTFEAVPIPEGMEAREAIGKLDLDAIAGVLHDFDYAHDNDLSLSSPYVKSLTWLIVRSDVDASDLSGKTLAATDDRLAMLPSSGSVIVCDTLQQCVAAVNRGDADYAYADGYTAPFYVNGGAYRNITAFPESSSESNICFAFPSLSDPMLLQIMNKAIEVMPTGVVNASIYRVVAESQKPSIGQFAKDYAIEIITVCFAVALVIVALVVLYARARSKVVKNVKAEKELLRIRAERDDLTGLLGVGAFREQAESLIAAGDAGAFAVLDIDDFKLVNDTMGHKKGDEALVCLASAIRRTFREGDVVGRIGGDEFAICMKGPVPDTALEEKCRELLARIRDFRAELGEGFGISIGAVFIGAGDTYAALYDRADKAMYEAKQGGKRGYSIV